MKVVRLPHTMIEPPGSPASARAFMCLTPSRRVKNPPCCETASRSLYIWVLILCSGAPETPPAFATTPSMRPIASIASAIPATTCASSATSTLWQCTRLAPILRSCSAACSFFAARRPQTTTSPPHLAMPLANPKPRPLFAPVTSPTLPVRSKRSNAVMSRLLRIVAERCARRCDLAFQPSALAEVLRSAAFEQQRMRGQCGLTGSAVLGSRVEHHIGEVQSLYGPACGDVRRGPRRQRVGATRELDQVTPDRARRHRVQLGGGFVTEPPRALLPNRAHVPHHLAVPPPELELGRWRDLAHQREEVGPGVHPGDGLVVHPLHRVAQLGEIGVDALGSTNPVTVTGYEQFRLQRA